MKFSFDDETGDLVLLENSFVVPPPADGQGRNQASGVLTADGSFVENSLSWTNSEEVVNTAPEMPAPAEVTQLPGTWMFGGILYGHFGHFILESMARVWGLGHADNVQGVIFTPKQIAGNFDNVIRVQRPLMDALGMTCEVRCASGPLQVERLYVPRQGVGMTDLSVGSRKFRDYITTHAGQDIVAKGAERIYISRSELPPQRGGLIGESILEDYLKAEGYEMFHPQKHPAVDQIAQYKAARKIISVDCSPLHLVAYVGDADQSVAILTRRSLDFTPSFVDQMAAFRDINAIEVNTLVRDWVPGGAPRSGRSSFGELDLTATWHKLKQGGMIDGDTPWPQLTDAQRQADLDRINERHGIEFRDLAENLAEAERRAQARRDKQG